MNWEAFWDQKAMSQHAFHQVGRIGGYHPQNIDIICEHIISSASILPHHHVLDVCCGNGLLTQKISLSCKHIIGVDQSKEQIRIAKETFPHLQFENKSGLEFTKLHNQKFDVILICFAFQYFDTFNKGKEIISALSSITKPGGVIFLSDVPDKNKFYHYYNTLSKRVRYLFNELTGKNDMGKFWSSTELDKICSLLNLDGKTLPQPHFLPYSNYRMDYIIQVK
jgi:2-polyprenyl-3-methyl-5-hydroxy-6-metoxy-1,4-benzoquinol methylase